MQVLVIVGHPRKDSLVTALAKAYVEGAKNAGCDTTLLFAADIDFNPNVTAPTPHLQHDEPDIVQAKQLIYECDHLVFFYPTWWGTMPAVLKGFIDRVFTSGFAFEEIEGGTGYEPLLRGRSAQLITTMDSPKAVYQLIYRAPGHNAMRRAILAFCGFRVTKITSMGPVKSSTAALREAWIGNMFKLGFELKNGRLTKRHRITDKAMAWLKAIRLQFYPMTFIAYSAGALAAVRSGDTMFNHAAFWSGYVWLFLVEMTTVFSNEYFDFESDRLNKSYSMFNGGSRVLITKGIHGAEMRRAIILVGCLSFLALGVLLFIQSAHRLQISVVCCLIFLLAVGYTTPPLKLVYRGLGEITVGITHSFAVIVCGYLFQGQTIFNPFPWVVSIPLFISILPSIILAGIPDHEADKAVAKKTIAVKYGTDKAAKAAIFCTVISALTVVGLIMLNFYSFVFSGILYGVIPHAVLLTWLLIKYTRSEAPVKRIDALIVAALTYLMWFAIVPLINLW